MLSAYKVLMGKSEGTRTLWRPIDSTIVVKRISKFEKCVKADMVVMAQNSFHCRAVVNMEAQPHSFVHSVHLTGDCVDTNVAKCLHPVH